MKISQLLTTVLVAGMPMVSTAQTVLSDFSALSSQSPTFGGTWTAVGGGEYSQSAEFVSIEPVSGGNPQGFGWFTVREDLDLTAYADIVVTAREDAGNLAGVFSVVFYNPDTAAGGGSESLGTSVGYTFTASDFAGGFTTLSINLADGPDWVDGTTPFDPSNVNYWEIEGDPVDAPSADFRMSFDNLQLTPVPEPATWMLLALGGGLFLWRRSRVR